MKKVLASLVLVAGVGVGIWLAGGLDGALERGRRALAELGLERAPFAATPAVEPQPPPAAAAPGAAAAPADGVAQAPRARIQRLPDGPPREQLTAEDRARLDRLVGAHLGE